MISHSLCSEGLSPMLFRINRGKLCTKGHLENHDSLKASTVTQRDTQVRAGYFRRVNLVVDVYWRYFIYFIVMGKSPIFRDIAMAVGAVNVHRDSCKFVLTQQGPGHSVAIVIGGVSDVLNTCANSYVLTLERRRGFVKLALETG